MKLMLSALAGGLLLGAVTSTPAEARCWWNGYSWQCAPRYYRAYRPYSRPYYRPYYSSGYHRHYYRHY